MREWAKYYHEKVASLNQKKTLQDLTIKQCASLDNRVQRGERGTLGKKCARSKIIIVFLLRFPGTRLFGHFLI